MHLLHLSIRRQRPMCIRDRLDIYPTLIELAGLDPREGLDGQSLVPLLKEPKLPWPRPVVSTYGHKNHSIRTERWRYIRYYDGTEELYDHDRDPYEWSNLAAIPVEKKHRTIINRLKKSLPMTLSLIHISEPTRPY